MELIRNNPFRIAGILSNATTRELQKQKAKIKAYSKVGKEIKSDYDFDILENITRTEDSIGKAFSNVEQNQDKVNYALFWFLNTSPIDNIAFEYLKRGNEEKAIEQWEKVTHDKEVNSKNFSAFNNFGTYKLLSQTKNDIKEGIEAKIKLIESDYFENFVHSVADETFTIDNEKQIEKLVDELLTQFKNQYSSSETLQLFSNCNGSTQKYLSQKFTEEPVHKIESQIESTKNERKEEKYKGQQLGLQLFIKTQDELSFLKSVVGTNDLKYKMIADNLAKEIMNCGIDYFQEWKNEKDPSKETLKLLGYAKSIAISNQIIDRAEENIEAIKEWAETAPIKEDLAFVTHKLKTFQNSNDTISNAKALVSSCRSRLENIRDILGSNDEFYLNISSAVVSNALGMVIVVVNEAQSELEYNRAKLIRLPVIASDAASAISAMGSLDMNDQTRHRYAENKSTINGIKNQLQNIKKQTRSYGSSSNHASSAPQSSSTSNNSSWAEENPGCLIALIIIGIIILANLLG